MHSLNPAGRFSLQPCWTISWVVRAHPLSNSAPILPTWGTKPPNIVCPWGKKLQQNEERRHILGSIEWVSEREWAYQSINEWCREPIVFWRPGWYQQYNREFHACDMELSSNRRHTNIRVVSGKRSLVWNRNIIRSRSTHVTEHLSQASFTTQTNESTTDLFFSRGHCNGTNQRSRLSERTKW